MHRRESRYSKQLITHGLLQYSIRPNNQQALVRAWTQQVMSPKRTDTERVFTNRKLSSKTSTSLNIKRIGRSQSA